ncbi:hypothetical protein WJX74_001025 [Apatococcus lobatus]|uniref:Uncharacterized protein n=1 Tax=Apatococcus lobatus TaxID=904363 RepID=A0AAW1SET9_9CHLO
MFTGTLPQRPQRTQSWVQYSGVSRRQPTLCSLRARWSLDCRYGRKGDAQALMQEWVRDVGSQAGLTRFNARISSGAVGVPESRLELEIELDGLAELDDFWSRIPAVGHKAWSERASHVIVDASPRWDVLRSVPLLTSEDSASASAPGRTLPQQQVSRDIEANRSSSTPDGDDASLQIPLEEGQAEALLAEQVKAMDAAASPHAAGSPQQKPGGRVVLDWKGDPMTIYPGDKLPM